MKMSAYCETKNCFSKLRLVSGGDCILVSN